MAVRDAERVYATTASSFASISVEPPLVLVSLGPTAQVLPFLDEGTAFVVNVLSEDQRRIATVHADAYPVGPSPFPAEGLPLLAGSQASLVCVVVRAIPLEGGVRMVLARVDDVTLGGEGSGPLLYHQRGYRSLG